MNKIRIKKLLFIFCLLFAVFAAADLALAATAGPDVGLETAAGTGLGASDPRIIAANIIRIILGFLGIIAVGLIIFAGWLWMTANGEEEKVAKAKKILIGAVVGLVICLASFAIASFILSRLLGATGVGSDGSICQPACSSGQYCCNSSCSNAPCGNIGGGGGGLETSCDANTLQPGCQIDFSKCGPGRYCNTTSCTCKTTNLPGEGQSCLKDALDTQCAAGQCAAGLSCSSTDCLCKKTNQPTEGQSCDGDTNLAGCQAVDCADSLVCSSGDNCTCIKTPLIAWVSPLDAADTPNGAIGNFITIGGRYFGTTVGQVIFMGDPNNASDDKVATFPNQVNPLCTSFWQDDQIIAVVPSGAVSGPIKVVDSKNYYDTTDNNRGARIKDFLINNIKRPGLCDVNPNSGGLADRFNLQGAAFNLSPHAVFFGNSANPIAANDISGWTNTAVDAAVPNIKDGRSSVFVQTNNINSNNLGFTIRNNADTNPAIEYIEPDKGPAGQYITIYGRNFKTYNAQKSLIKFYLPADPNAKINADIDFPEACRDNWWHNTYIIVKVPKVNSLGTYKVEVTNTDNKVSLPADFTINNETPSPGLCLLNPNNGPVGWPVAANGERFGNAQGTGRVQYFNNKDGAVRGWADKKIDTNVPLDSASGPFKIIDGQGYFSNPLPFRVGKCATSAECDASQNEECCGGGTYWSGICRTAGTCLQGSPTACGFGWTFKTSKKQVGDPCDPTKSQCSADLVCDPTAGICKQSCNSNSANNVQCLADNSKCAYTNTPTCNIQSCLCECTKDSDCTNGYCDKVKKICTTDAPLESCAGYGDQCSDSYFCPNSPGKCSSNAGGSVATGVKCGNDVCKELSGCKGAGDSNLCSYSAILNKCKKISDTCDLAKTISDVNGKQVELKCGLVDNKNVWYYDSQQTCVGVYTKSIDKTKCLDQACDACGNGFNCAAENGAGVCAVSVNICPDGSSCNNGQCANTQPKSCECCCDKTQNTASGGNPGCCSGLSCTDNCGSGGDFGSCTGCTVKNGNVADQTASNAKCNCEGTSGKFCSTGEAGGLGKCLDCASIANAKDCSEKGAGSCCADAQNKNVCRGVKDGEVTVKSIYAGDNNNYCGYYKCNAGNNGCNKDKAIASSTVAVYSDTAKCAAACVSAPVFGQECSKEVAKTDQCAADVCPNFSCLDADGYGVGNPSTTYAPDPKNKTCGTCCCNPNAATDQCKRFINPKLSCLADKGNCSGASRGLCCGCSQDSECGDANAVGCGSDTCCQARPKVIDGTTDPRPDNYPKPFGGNVCRNSLIQATFDQPMQINIFGGNVIVVGDYGASQCPAGTKYLTVAYKSNIFTRIKFWLAKIPLVNKLFASEALALTGNFCAVPGKVSGRVVGQTTKLEFAPQKLLEADRTYYVIIKGDSLVTDAIHDGVLSQAGIGLNSTLIDDKVFNGVTFKGKIWSFTTKENTAANNGVCLVNNVSINPSGYLFNTIVNNPADDAGADDQTIKDSDKIFRATAYYAPGQPIVPIENVYNWRWDWSIDDKAVVKFKNGENALNDRAEQTLVAQNVKEANTLLHAKATIIEDKVNKLSAVGQFKENTAEIYVFLCSNPWPPFKDDGSWQPWREPTNCTIDKHNCGVAGNESCCYATNYELYYCRDAGTAGTADDLPAIMSDSTVIRGQEQNILKEFYFFREGTPNVAGVNLATTINDIIKQGGRVGLTWAAITVPSGQILDKYLVYYGTKSGSFEQSIATTTPGTIANPQIINGLTNGTKYYFAVTAKYKSGAESGYSNETNAIPNDTAAPKIPEDLVGTADTGKAVINWTANTDDTAFYKIYYGAKSGALGASVSLEKSQCSSVTGKCQITISNLTAGVTYYFAISAIDSYKNESNKSAEINLKIE